MIIGYVRKASIKVFLVDQVNETLEKTAGLIRN
jgi:hypothetical protein